MPKILAIACVLLAALVLPACGGSSGGDFTAGSGGIVLTGIAPPALLGCASQPFTITGSGFETLTGTTVKVTFRALGGATPFAGGTSDTATVTGLVTSDTTITGTSPEAVLCGVASVTFEVSVMLEIGVTASSTGIFTGTIAAPTITSILPTSFPSEIATPFTITGTGFGAAGTPVTVRFLADGGATLFGDGTQPYFDVLGTVTSPTTITGTSPLAAVCGADTATASLQLLFTEGCCSAPTGGGFVTFVAPTIASTSAPSVPSEVPTAFTLTGTGYPAVGTNVTLRFVSTTGGAIFANGTATSIDLTGSVTSSTTITGTTPAAALCGIASATARLEAYFPGGSCEITGPAFQTFVAPTIVSTSAPVVPGLVPTAFTLTGTGFPLVGTNVTLRFVSTAAIFADGTATSIDLGGTVTSTTTITGTTPAATVCGVDTQTAVVQAYFPAGSCATSGAAFVTFQRPTLATASHGGIRNTNLPVANFPDNDIFSFEGGDPFELTAFPGRSFGAIGSVVQVRFTTVGEANWQGGAQDFDTVLAQVTSATTIEGATPPTTFGGSPINVTVQAFWEDGTCSDTTTAVFTQTTQMTFAEGASVYTIAQNGTGAPSLIGAPVSGRPGALAQRRNRVYGFDGGTYTVFHTGPTMAVTPTAVVPVPGGVGFLDPRDLAVDPASGVVWAANGSFDVLVVMRDDQGNNMDFVFTPPGSVPNRILFNEASDEMIVEFDGTDEMAVYGLDSQSLEALYAVTPLGPAVWNGVMALRPGSAADARVYFVLDDPAPAAPDSLAQIQLSTGVYTVSGVSPPDGAAPGAPSALCYDARRDQMVWHHNFLGGAFELRDPETMVITAGPFLFPASAFSITDDPIDDRWYLSDNLGGLVVAVDPLTFTSVGSVVVTGAARNVSTSP